MPSDQYRTVEANGLRFAFLEAGSGPLVLCLHGFPDTPHTFDRLLPELAMAGYHAVAPAMRGTYPTDIPKDKDYSPVELGRDAIALITALGERRGAILGHDLGAMGAYAAANLNAAIITKMITIAIPHPRAIRINLGLIVRGWHFAFLPIPLLAERVARWNDFALLRHFRHAWSPNLQVAATVMDEIRTAYSQPGSLRAALGNYRSSALVFAGMGKEKRHDREILLRQTTVPTLCFAGDVDGVFDEATFDRTPEAFTGYYELVKLKDAGHFLHLECAEEFRAKVVAFLHG
jgi:pimeloyl-ACP methyl ester carboxylesterase